MDAFPLAFAQVEALVAGFLGVHEDRVPALTARFKLLRRLRFPPGVNVGKAGRFHYDLDATMRTMIVFALMDGLMLPQQAVALITDEWAVIGAEVRRILAAFRARSATWPSGEELEGRRFMVLEARGQSRWIGPAPVVGPGTKKPYRPRVSCDLSIVDYDRLAGLLRPLGLGEPRPALIVIDLTSLTEWTAAAISRAGWDKGRGTAVSRG